MKRMILRWIARIFGILDIPQIAKAKVKKKSSKKNSDHWGTIKVSNDTQLDHSVEPMDSGTQSCPYWYSTRIFKGTEVSPGTGKEPEYWVGIRCTFLAPIIPIPICSDEKVFKLGKNRTAYDDAYRKYGRWHSLLDHRDEFAHRIIEEADVEFDKSDVSYSDDEIWESNNYN